MTLYTAHLCPARPVGDVVHALDEAVHHGVLLTVPVSVGGWVGGGWVGEWVGRVGEHAVNEGVEDDEEGVGEGRGVGGDRERERERVRGEERAKRH